MVQKHQEVHVVPLSQEVLSILEDQGGQHHQQSLADLDHQEDQLVLSRPVWALSMWYYMH